MNNKVEDSQELQLNGAGFCKDVTDIIEISEYLQCTRWPSVKETLLVMLVAGKSFIMTQMAKY